MTNFTDVGEFHKKFDLPVYEGADAIPVERWRDTGLMDYRVKFLQEELDEFILGLADGDIAQMADALVDLVYVAQGTAHMLHLPWEVLWDDVQRANMAKERAAKDGSDSKRGSAWDVVKPEGWTPPSTEAILRNHGFDI